MLYYNAISIGEEADRMEGFPALVQAPISALTAFLAQNPVVGAWYMAFVRFLFPVLAVLIL